MTGTITMTKTSSNLGYYFIHPRIRKENWLSGFYSPNSKPKIIDLPIVTTLIHINS